MTTTFSVKDLGPFDRQTSANDDDDDGGAL